MVKFKKEPDKPWIRYKCSKKMGNSAFFHGKQQIPSRGMKIRMLQNTAGPDDDDKKIDWPQAAYPQAQWQSLPASEAGSQTVALLSRDRWERLIAAAETQLHRRTWVSAGLITVQL